MVPLAGTIGAAVISGLIALRSAAINDQSQFRSDILTANKDLRENAIQLEERMDTLSTKLLALNMQILTMSAENVRLKNDLAEMTEARDAALTHAPEVRRRR